VEALVEQAASPAQWSEAAALIRAYLAELPFEIDFQDLDRELVELPSEYGPPLGAGLLARAADGGAALGFVGLRPFAEREAELKRMYVDPSVRGQRVGRALAVGAVHAARQLGYRRILLDTVATMAAAIATYESLGFEPIGAYRHNPRPDARYFALDLAPD
jgi:GNAT superfamily N-acetyltransferase